MIERFIHDLTLKAKSATGASGEVVIWAIAGAFFSILAIVFLSIAAYAWLATIFTSAAALLLVAVGHLVIVAAAFSRCVYVRSRNRSAALAQIQFAAKQHSQSGWKIDPAYLAVGLEVAKAVGLRNIIPMVVGLAAAGWAGSRKASGRSPR